MSIIANVYNWVGNRFNLSLRDEGFWRYYTGTESYSGKSVTQQSALQLSVVWGCVRLLAETIATLPISLYAIDSEGKTKVAENDLLHGILHDTPNGEMTAVDFWESLLCSILLWGNAYAEINRTGDVITGLTPLRPELMQLLRASDGSLFYRYSPASGLREYAENEMFHVRGFSLDGLLGLSPIAYARNSMGAAMAIEEATAVTFARGMRPGGVLQMPQVLKPEQRKQVEENIVSRFAGTLGAGRSMLLEGGMEYKQITMNPEDAQMLQSRAFSVEELCRWFRVPPFMVGYTEKTTSWGTGLEQQNIGFLTYSLRPYLKRIEQQVKRQLIPASLRKRRFAEFNLEGLLRADSAARAALWSSLSQNGVMTRNEIRAKENLPPKDGGDELTVQSNLIPISNLGLGANAAAATGVTA